MVRVTKPILLSIMVLLLQSCTYSGKFSCPDSKGAACVMLSRVDQMVDSGEIEKYHNGKKCLFGRCSNNEGENLIIDRPPLAPTEVIKAKIPAQEEKLELKYIEGDYLYVK